MKRFLVYLFIMIISFIMQTSVFRLFDRNMSGVTPDFLLIFTVSFALMRGERTGTVLGFASGLLMDVVFGEYLGFYAMILMFLGYMAGFFVRIFPPGSHFFYIVIAAAADLVYGFVNYVLLFLLRARFNLGFYMLHVIMPEVVITAVVSMLLIPVYSAVNEALDVNEKRRAKKFV